MHKALIGAIFLVSLIPGFAHAAQTAAQTPTIYTLLGTSTPVESSAAIEKEVVSFSPQAGSMLLPVLNAIDAGRAATARFLDAQIKATAPKLPGNGLVNLSTTVPDTSQMSWQSALQSITGVLWTIYFYLLVLVRYVIARVILCYPLLIAAVIYLAFVLFRRLWW